IGVIMAFMSLSRVEKILTRWVTRKWMPAVLLLIIFLGSFGVYLGRFLRWNSWDIIRHPFSLLWTISEKFIHPVEHVRTWGMTGILTVLFYLMYSFFGVTTASRRQTPKAI
ncbi:MAG TPA: DUF1361 domain-containing protein, partial [Ferruginibacter sp.]|nr:DUF1361 domain-containing protein [Ferruginibacter sp.]